MLKWFPLRAILSLALLATFVYVTIQTYERVYLPACERRAEAEAREATLQQQVNEITLQIAALEMTNSALEAEEPLAVEEAIRKELGWGQEDEYALIDPQLSGMDW
ncbi:MAG: hypothetical protein JXA52_07305 [Planctomycetes bacterium]|nr:hypothetical protein [Planctomycetota bacterium]